MQPRWYQTEAVATFWGALCARPGAAPVIVLPTGAGKSVVIAMLCREAMEKFQGRVLVLAHRKELLEQNAEKIRANGVPAGLYSAGLRERDTETDVLVAGIHSVFCRAHELGRRHLVLIDEAHLLPTDGEGMYRTLLADLARYNPGLRLGGLTATPFRTDCGPLCGPDRLFTRVCYSAPIRDLVEQGYLCRLTTQSEPGFDTSGLHMRGGEFVQHEAESLFSGDDAKVQAACREIVARTRERRSVLIFCSGIRHAEKVSQAITDLTGDVCGLITNDTDGLGRASTLAEFRAGRMRYCANVDVLTTGFDAPGIDAIAILRATASPGLFMQICGRGFRRALGKPDCLVLDFGENFKRHGPLDAVDFGATGTGTGTPGEAPSKKCPNCNEELALSATECSACGWKFPRELKHQVTPDTDAQVLSAPERWTVLEMTMAKWQKKKDLAAPPTLRVDYVCTQGGNLPEVISEWVCLQHPGFAGRKAASWWAQHCLEPFAPDIDVALELNERGAFAAPTEITTVREGRFWRITARDGLKPPTELLGDAHEPPGAVAEDEWSQPSEEIPF